MLQVVQRARVFARLKLAHSEQCPTRPLIRIVSQKAAQNVTSCRIILVLIIQRTQIPKPLRPLRAHHQRLLIELDCVVNPVGIASLVRGLGELFKTRNS
jgi:hypothetical protein